MSNKPSDLYLHPPTLGEFLWIVNPSFFDDNPHYPLVDALFGDLMRQQFKLPDHLVSSKKSLVEIVNLVEIKRVDERFYSQESSFPPIQIINILNTFYTGLAPSKTIEEGGDCKALAVLCLTYLRANSRHAKFRKINENSHLVIEQFDESDRWRLVDPQELRFGPGIVLYLEQDHIYNQHYERILGKMKAPVDKVSFNDLVTYLSKASQFSQSP